MPRVYAIAKFSAVTFSASLFRRNRRNGLSSTTKECLNYAPSPERNFISEGPWDSRTIREKENWNFFDLLTRSLWYRTTRTWDICFLRLYEFLLRRVYIQKASFRFVKHCFVTETRPVFIFVTVYVMSVQKQHEFRKQCNKIYVALLVFFVGH